MKNIWNQLSSWLQIKTTAVMKINSQVATWVIILVKYIDSLVGIQTGMSPWGKKNVSDTPFTDPSHCRLTINVCLPSLSHKGKGFRSFQTSLKAQRVMTFRESFIGQTVSLTRGCGHIHDSTWDFRKWKSYLFSYLGRFLVPLFLLCSLSLLHKKHIASMVI